MDSIQLILLCIILGYIATSYILGTLINIFDYKFRIKKDYTLKPKVSVLISAFNEGAAVYNTVKSLRESDYPQELLQIVGFDDQSKDDTFDWLQKAAADFPNVKAVRNQVNLGKGLHLMLFARNQPSLNPPHPL